MARETQIDEEKCDRVIIVIMLMEESRWWVCGCLLQSSFNSAIFEKLHNKMLGEKDSKGSGGDRMDLGEIYYPWRHTYKFEFGGED